MESRPINEAPIATSMNNANALGFDAYGELVKYPLSGMLRSEKGIAYPSTVPAGARFLGEEWKVDTASYGATFTYFGGINVPIKVGEQYVSNARFVYNAGSWVLQKELVDLPSLTPYAKSSAIFTSESPNYFDTNYSSGRYAVTTGVPGFSVASSTTNSHAGVFPIASGDLIAFEGLNTSLANANVGVLFDAAGYVLGSLLVSDLVTITGGRKITVPTLTGLAFVGFNITNADIPAVKIQRGGIILAAKVKPELLPAPVNKTSQLTNDSDYLNGTVGVKAASIFETNPDYLPNFVLTTGRYSGNGTGTNFPVTASATNNHSPVYPVVAGDTFAIEGLNTTLSSADVGRLFNIDGTPIQIIVPSTDLVTISGGKKYTVPALSGVAFIGFNVTVADSPSVKVQRGGAILKLKLKIDIVPGNSPVTAALNGKRILVCGDSITFGTGTTTKAYHSYLADWLGLVITNEARSGTGLVKPFGSAVGMYKRVGTWPAASAIDGISIMCNMNDGFGPFNDGGSTPYPSGLPVGTFADTTPISTFGAMRWMVEYIQTNYPLIPLVFIISTPRNSTASNGMCWGKNGWYQAHADAIEYVCGHYSVPCLNLYNSSGVKPWISANNTAYFDAADGTHLNAAGHNIIAREIYPFWVKNLF